MRRKKIPTTELEKRLEEVEKKLEDTTRILHGVIALGGRDMLERARELAEIETMPYSIDSVEQEGILKGLGEKRLKARKQLSKEDLEEYERIIAENNNH